MTSLLRLEVPAGPAGLELLRAPVTAALNGTGPAIAPVPAPSPTVSADYLALLDSAIAVDRPLEDDRTAAVLATSGSTGAPHGVLLSAEGLLALHPWREMPSSWVAALPLTSMGGFNVLVRALSAQAPIVALHSLAGAEHFTAQDFAESVELAAREGLPVRTSLVPAQLARLLDSHRGLEALQRCETVLIGGAALDPALRARAQDVALTATYGATETSGGCVYDGIALPGAHVELAPDGRITLRGAMTALGYRLDPSATAEHFDGDAFRTQDLGEQVDGRLRVLGRIDDVVTVNGINVSALAVQSALLELDGMRECAVIAVPDDRTGNALIAYCVGSIDAELARTHVAQRLGAAARPRITTIESLPLLPGGKVDRQSLRRHALMRGNA